MIEVVTLLTETHKIIIIESQLRELLEVLDVVYRRRWSLTSVPPAPHTHILVPAQYCCALGFPYRACIEFIHSYYEAAEERLEISSAWKCWREGGGCRATQVLREPLGKVAR